VFLVVKFDQFNAISGVFKFLFLCTSRENIVNTVAKWSTVDQIKNFVMITAEAVSITKEGWWIPKR
jgi:hypothetical protein